MRQLQKVPDILKDFDPVLTKREQGRLLRHNTTYADIMAAVVERNMEREAQIFLYDELLRQAPRESVLDRLCGILQRMEARRKRIELMKFAALPARKRY